VCGILVSSFMISQNTAVGRESNKVKFVIRSCLENVHSACVRRSENENYYLQVTRLAYDISPV